MKRLLLSIFALSLFGISLFAMDDPMADVGKKRPADQIEQIAPEAKEGRVEAEESINYLLSQLDKPTQEKIRSYLETAPGFGIEKLYNVANNIRNVRLVSTKDREILDDPEFVEKLIQSLATRYANGDGVKVALALHTKSAADWLNKKLLQDTRKPDDYRLFEKKVTNEIIDQLNVGHVDAARFLLNAAKVPGKNRYMVRFGYANAANRQTLLQAAAKAGDLALFNTILAHSLPIINHQNDDDETALLIAISNKHTPIAFALLEAGASLVAYTREDEGEEPEIRDTALIRAASQNNTEVVQKILARPDSQELINVFAQVYSPIYYAVSNNNYPMFKALLAVPGIDIDGETLYGALSSNTQMVKALIAKKIELDQEVLGREGGAVFGIFAVSDDNKFLVNDADARDRLLLLLSANLDVNTRSSGFKKTLLMFAVQQNKARTVEELLRAGARVNLSDVEGKTALDYAQDLGSDSKDRIIKMLVDAAQKQGAKK